MLKRFGWDAIYFPVLRVGIWVTAIDLGHLVLYYFNSDKKKTWLKRRVFEFVF